MTDKKCGKIAKNICSFPKLDINDRPDLPVCVRVDHDGFWITNNNGIHISSLDYNCDRNSVMLTPNSLLYIYKLAFRHLLLSMKVITSYDIDAQNLVPHIVVRKNKADTNSNYNKIQGETFIITDESLSDKTDFLIIELDRERDLHMTVCYSKKNKITNKLN